MLITSWPTLCWDDFTINLGATFLLLPIWTQSCTKDLIESLHFVNCTLLNEIGMHQAPSAFVFKRLQSVSLILWVMFIFLPILKKMRSSKITEAEVSKKLLLTFIVFLMLWDISQNEWAGISYLLLPRSLRHYSETWYCFTLGSELFATWKTYSIHSWFLCFRKINRNVAAMKEQQNNCNENTGTPDTRIS